MLDEMLDWFNKAFTSFLLCLKVNVSEIFKNSSWKNRLSSTIVFYSLRWVQGIIFYTNSALPQVFCYLYVIPFFERSVLKEVRILSSSPL